MSFRISAKMPDLAKIADEALSEVAADATDAMRGATATLKTALRQQITDAGMGTRLANTWRAETYPGSSNALNPSGYAWSNAPDIVTAFSTGATIRPLEGRQYLWIPSNAVPRQTITGRASSKKKMTPPQVLEAFNADSFLIRKGKGGHLLAFIVEQRGLTARGARRRPRRGRLAHGTTGELVLMFTLVRSVTLPQSLDLDAAAKAGSDDFVARFNSARSR